MHPTSCLSVTRWYEAKTSERRTTRLSHRLEFFETIFDTAVHLGTLLVKALNDIVVGQNMHFTEISELVITRVQRRC